MSVLEGAMPNEDDMLPKWFPAPPSQLNAEVKSIVESSIGDMSFRSPILLSAKAATSSSSLSESLASVNIGSRLGTLNAVVLS